MDPKQQPQKEKEEQLKLKVEPEAVLSGEDDLKIDSIFADKYKVVSRLGAGGMSVVYKGHDLVLNRSVAIKILARKHAPAQISQLRFQQEARAAGALSHAGIVGVHEFAQSRDGLVYLIMDCIDGKSLSAVLAEHGHISAQRLVSIIRQAASALSYAHKRGIVHRDLKPSNIMLIEDDSGSESCKIVDFGIAKIITPGEGQTLTQTGEILGSPLYMSPEQCSGTSADQRSDIYSLGCVMYEALTGQPPLAGESALSTAVMHLNQKPKTLAEARPDLQFTPELDALIAKTLEKDPASRYQSMDELLNDLDLLSAGRLAITKQQEHTQPSVNQTLFVFAILCLICASLLAAVFPIGDHSIANFKTHFAIQALLLLVGLDVFLASALFPVSKKRATSAIQGVKDDLKSIPLAASKLDRRLQGRLAWFLIVQLILFGLGVVWADNPDRSLFDPLTEEKLHPSSQPSHQ